MTTSAVPALRLVSGALLCCYAAVVTAILLNADPSFATDVIERTRQALVGRGAPAWLTWGERVQLMLNALMFAPVTALASLAFPRQPWGNWVAYSFLASGLVEVVQAFVLEPRSAQYVDVVANTLGGLVGAVLVIPLSGRWRRLSDERSG